MNKDALFQRLIPWVIMCAVAALVAFYLYAGPTMYLDWIFLLMGVLAAIVSVYLLTQRMGQERKMQFYDGEQVLLTSHDSRSFALVTSIGENNVNQTPINATIYLTNMGIIAEPPGTGEIALFIPLDTIHDFTGSQNGIRVRFTDVKHGYTEVLLYVDNRDQWLTTLNGIFNQPRT